MTRLTTKNAPQVALVLLSLGPRDPNYAELRTPLNLVADVVSPASDLYSKRQWKDAVASWRMYQRIARSDRSLVAVYKLFDWLQSQKMKFGPVGLMALEAEVRRLWPEWFPDESRRPR